MSPTDAAAEPIQYAVVIGQNAPPQGAEELDPLKFADDDAIRFHRLMERVGANSHLLTVPDRQTERKYPQVGRESTAPTKQNLKRLASSLKQKMESDRERGDEPILYFIFGGHGTYDEKGMARLSLLDDEVSRSFLVEHFIEPLPTKYTHFIIDACHGAGIVAQRGDMFDREVTAETESLSESEREAVVGTQVLDRYPGVGVLAAAAPGESSHEWSQLSAGVFAHEVISGLLGAADINGDRKVTYSEIEAFISAANNEVENPKAVPSIIAEPPEMSENAILVHLERASGPKLVGNPGGLGHFYINLENGVRYLDANLSPAGHTMLLLPRRRSYLISGEREAALSGRDKRVAISQLQFRPRTASKRGSVADALQKGLFRAKFSRPFYEGYIATSDRVGVDFSSVDRSDAEVTAASAESDTSNSTAAWALAGTSGALLVTSGIATGLAIDAKSDFESTPYQKPAQEAADRHQTRSIVAIATGVGAVGTGIAAYLLWPHEQNSTPSETKMGLIPNVHADRAGVSIFVPW